MDTSTQAAVVPDTSLHACLSRIERKITRIKERMDQRKNGAISSDKAFSTAGWVLQVAT